MPVAKEIKVAPPKPPVVEEIQPIVEEKPKVKAIIDERLLNKKEDKKEEKIVTAQDVIDAMPSDSQNEIEKEILKELRKINAKNKK